MAQLALVSPASVDGVPSSVATIVQLQLSQLAYSPPLVSPPGLVFSQELLTLPERRSKLGAAIRKLQISFNVAAFDSILID